MSVSPGLANYSGAQSYTYYDRALAALRSVPGVESAGLTSNPVLAGLNSFANVTVEGYRNTDQRFVLTGRNKVTAGFFATLGIPLLSGRYFEDADAGKSVVIVNREFATTFFNGSSPIGKHVAIGSGQGTVPDLEVVGVVDDYHQKRLREAPIPALFTPISRANSSGSAAFYVKARSSTLPSAISETLRRVDPAIAVHSIDTVEHLVAAAGATDRLFVVGCSRLRGDFTVAGGHGDPGARAIRGAGAPVGNGDSFRSRSIQEGSGVVAGARYRGARLGSRDAGCAGLGGRCAAHRKPPVRSHGLSG